MHVYERVSLVAGRLHGLYRQVRVNTVTPTCRNGLGPYFRVAPLADQWGDNCDMEYIAMYVLLVCTTIQYLLP
jgi:hypothetical protein